MVEIDGSYGEGGGQVLRTALTLSALTGQPTRFQRIRAGRRNPGLAPQHLAGVLALARICAAEVQSAAIGSTEIVFEPRSGPRPGEYLVDVAQESAGGSAGSVSLILQTLLLPLALAGGGSRVILKGGTNVPWSPSYEYLDQVYLPAAARMGLQAACRLDGRGFYPAGGGQISAEVYGLADPTPASGQPTSTLAPLTLVERGGLVRLSGLALACDLPAHIAQRMAARSTNVLSQAGLRSAITPRRERGGPGAFVWLLAEYEHVRAGFSALGEKGKPSEQVADEACRALLAHCADGAPVEPFLADQLLLPMALAAGRSEFRTSRVSRHLLTNAYVIRQFVPAQIEIGGQEGEPGYVRVQGVGIGRG
jgi:RNA 3'-terminal phosphate cyclase (ATP)